MANLSGLPDDLIESLRAALKGESIPASEGIASPEKAISIHDSRQHGHVAAIHSVLKRSGLPGMIDSKRSRERDVVAAMVIDRIINGGSKLSTVRQSVPETASTSLGELLSLGDLDENECYAAMDWLLKRQGGIQRKLAKKHLAAGEPALFDLSSSHFEGQCCELAEFGYSRDHRGDRKQVNYGIYCNAEGTPVGVEVLAGNQGDRIAFPLAVERVRNDFNHRNIIFIGDRGMISGKAIDQYLRGEERADWITALNGASIAKLERSGSIQLSLFDDLDLVSITHPDYPDERLVVCRNPVLASFRFVGANAGIFTVTLSLPFLVSKIGRGNVQLGHSGAVAVLALMAGALFFVTFKTSTERIRPPDQKHEPFRTEIKELGRNGPWLMIIVVSILTVLSQAIRATSTLHFFKYVVGREDWGTKLLLYNSIAAIVAVMLAKWVCSLVGDKKKTYMVLNLLFAVLLVWFYFIPRESFVLMIVNQILIAFVAAPMMPLFWSMIADTADYGAVKFGHRSTGVIFSAGTASQKIGWSIGPAIAMWILGVSGFVANASQTPETVQTLRLLMSFIPAGFAIATAAATVFYKIDRKMETELETALRAMNQSSAMAE